MKKQCVVCGKGFMPRDKRCKCCSNRCRNLKNTRKRDKTDPKRYRLFTHVDPSASALY